MRVEIDQVVQQLIANYIMNLSFFFSHSYCWCIRKAINTYSKKVDCKAYGRERYQRCSEHRNWESRLIEIILIPGRKHRSVIHDLIDFGLKLLGIQILRILL